MFIRETFLACDYCGETYGADDRSLNRTAKELRANAGGFFRFINGKDICEECFASGEHLKEAHNER